MYFVHGNPRQFEPLIRIAQQLGGPLVAVSDRRGGGDVWLMELIYRYLDDPHVRNRITHELSDSALTHIMLRCRFLRILDTHLAYRLVLAGFAAFEELFDRYPSKVLLTRPVDYYLNDILMRVATHRNIKILAFSESPAAGLTLVSALGDWHPIRDPSDEEIDKTMGQWRRRGHFSEYVLLGSQRLSHHIRRVVEYRLRDAYRWTQRRIQRDPLNQHYFISRFRQTPRSIRDFPFGVNFAKSIDRSSGRPVLLWTLGRTPEATTDYLCPGFEVLEFDKFVLGAAQAMSEHFDLAIKDHLDIIGVRPSDFYRKLSKIPNVTLLDPRVPATQFYDDADVVLTATGTTGIEAIAYGKPVVRFGHNYWTTDWNSQFIHAREMLAGRLTPEFVGQNPARGQTGDDAARRTVQRMLATAIPGNFMYPRYPQEQRHAEVATALPIIRQLVETPGKLNRIKFAEEFPDPALT